MCCLITTLFLLGPRAAILVWWLINQPRWNLAFDTFLWPLLGFIFAPWTTLMYMIVFPAGVNGFDWIWIGLGILADLSTWFGGGYGNRDRLRG